MNCRNGNGSGFRLQMEAGNGSSDGKYAHDRCNVRKGLLRHSSGWGYMERRGVSSRSRDAISIVLRQGRPAPMLQRWQPMADYVCRDSAARVKTTSLRHGMTRGVSCCGEVTAGHGSGPVTTHCTRRPSSGLDSEASSWG
jgi:hypothetical protein